MLKSNLVKLLMIIFLFSAIIYKFVFINENKPLVLSENNVEKTIEKSLQATNIKIEDYVISYVVINKNSNFIIGSNVEYGDYSQTIFSKLNCEFLINTGFYDKNKKHIGLYAIENNMISNVQDNKLFNGYVLLKDQLYIDNSYDNQALGFQSGPLFISNMVGQKYSYKNNEKARRMIAADTNNEMIFIAIYKDSNYLMGPALYEIIDIIRNIEKSIGVKFNNAINLDGGSASCFITKDFKITEVQTIGGYICADLN